MKNKFNDLQQALLMKIDAFHYIQLGTVYRYLCSLLHQGTQHEYNMM